MTAGAAIGLMGGTFDPIHLGHLAIAEDVRGQLGLERVVFLPAGQPQLRSGPPVASAEHRAAMVELAIAGNTAFTIDRQEVDRPGPTFAVDTLQALQTDAGATDPWFILSAEALLGLPRWRSPDRVLALARLAVVPRAGTSTPDREWVESAFPGCGDRVRFLDGPLLGLSGTAIRARIRAGRSIRYLVPDAVRDYIKDHDLYRT